MTVTFSLQGKVKVGGRMNTAAIQKVPCCIKYLKFRAHWIWNYVGRVDIRR